MNHIVEYNITDAAIAELSNQYMTMKVNSATDDVGYKMVHYARMVVKGKRVEVEKKRKELKEDALRYGKAVDTEAKRITALLEPIEDHLAAQEKIVDDEKARLKSEAEAKEAARLQARIDRICSFGAQYNGWSYLAYGYDLPTAMIKTCTDEQFETFIGKIQAAKDTEYMRLKAEEEAKRKEREEFDRIKAAFEADRKRLDEIARKQAEEAARMRQEQEAINAAQEAIEREKRRLADEEAARLKAIADEEKRKANEKRYTEEIEAAKIKAVNEAEDRRLKKIEQDRIAAEKKAARLPDKKKLLLLADEWSKEIKIELKTKEGKDILDTFKRMLIEAIDYLRTNSEKL